MMLNINKQFCFINLIVFEIPTFYVHVLQCINRDTVWTDNDGAVRDPQAGFWQFFPVKKDQISILKSAHLKAIQFWIQFFLNKKFRNCACFFTCIWPDYVANAITKEFWKNNYFESVTAGFLQRCPNLLQRITPEMMHFQAWKKLV